MYQTSLYRVRDDKLIKLARTALGSREAALEQWIWDDPALLGEPLVLLGREVLTEYGKRIDLLAIDEEEQICVIELKRDKTPREVIAQALDYASWIAEVDWPKLDEIAQQHFGQSVSQRYADRFGNAPALDEPPEPRLIIVASQLDEASERIARFLTDRGIAINALFFSVFQDGAEELLARNWLLNPIDAEQRTTQAAKRKSVKNQPSGYWFFNVGTNDPDLRRSWDDNHRYGFMSAGPGPKYAQLIGESAVGERVYAYLSGPGYVGLGEITAAATPIAQFVLPDGSHLEPASLEQPRILEHEEDLERCEYAIGVRWIRAVSAQDAIKGIWASPRTVCSLNQPRALSELQKALPERDLTEPGETATSGP